MIEGTNAQDQISKMARAAFAEARVDLRFEEKVWEINGLMHEVRAVEANAAHGLEGGGAEDDDVELKRRVVRSR